MRRPRGFGFVVVILMLGVVSMVAASISLRTQRNLQLTAGQTRQQAGDDVAYSGLQVGLAHAASAGAEDWSGLEGLVTMPQRTQLGYRLLVNSNFNNEDALIDPDGTEIPGGQRRPGPFRVRLAQGAGRHLGRPVQPALRIKPEKLLTLPPSGQVWVHVFVLDFLRGDKHR